MVRISSSRYSAVAATAALVVSLGGTSYAVARVGTADLENGAVTSPKIRNGQVTSADVRNNGLTGADVNERRLGRVPRSSVALNSARVGGARVVRVSASRGVGAGPAAYAFRGNGLEIELQCSGPNLELVARTTRSGAFISTVVSGDSQPAPGQARLGALENGGFAPGADFDLLGTGDGDVNQATFVYANQAGNTTQGTLAVDTLVGSPKPCRVMGFLVTR